MCHCEALRFVFWISGDLGDRFGGHLTLGPSKRTLAKRPRLELVGTLKLATLTTLSVVSSGTQGSQNILKTGPTIEPLGTQSSGQKFIVILDIGRKERNVPREHFLELLVYFKIRHLHNIVAEILFFVEAFCFVFAALRCFSQGPALGGGLVGCLILQT